MRKSLLAIPLFISTFFIILFITIRLDGVETSLKVRISTNERTVDIIENMYGGVPFTIILNHVIRYERAIVAGCVKDTGFSVEPFQYAPGDYSVEVRILFNSRSLFPLEATGCIESRFKDLVSKAMIEADRLITSCTDCTRSVGIPRYKVDMYHTQSILDLGIKFLLAYLLTLILGRSLPEKLLWFGLVSIIFFLPRAPVGYSEAFSRIGTVMYTPIFIYGYFSHNNIVCNDIDVAPRYKWIYVANDEKMRTPKSGCDLNSLIPRSFGDTPLASSLTAPQYMAASEIWAALQHYTSAEIE